MGDLSLHSAGSASRDKKKKKKAEMASISQTLAFAFDCGGKNIILFCIGTLGGIGNGAVRGEKAGVTILHGFFRRAQVLT